MTCKLAGNVRQLHQHVAVQEQLTLGANPFINNCPVVGDLTSGVDSQCRNEGPQSALQVGISLDQQ